MVENQKLFERFLKMKTSSKIEAICNFVKDRIRDDISGVDNDAVSQETLDLLNSPNTPDLLEKMKKSCYWNGEEALLFGE